MSWWVMCGALHTGIYGNDFPAPILHKLLHGACSIFVRSPHRHMRRGVGRPSKPTTSKHFGYLTQQISDAEAAIKRLKQTQAALEEDNDRQNSTLGIFDSGISAADRHLAFLLISRCAFSRQTRTLLKEEDAHNASSTLNR